MQPEPLAELLSHSLAVKSLSCSYCHLTWDRHRQGGLRVPPPPQRCKPSRSCFAAPASISAYKIGVGWWRSGHYLGFGKWGRSRDLLLRRARLSPLAVPGCCCQGLCCDLCSYSKLRQLQVSVWCERGTWGLWTCLVMPWPFQPGLVDQEGLLPAPLVQAREELGAWHRSAVPASLLSAEGAGWGASNCRDRTECLSGRSWPWRNYFLLY